MSNVQALFSTPAPAAPPPPPSSARRKVAMILPEHTVFANDFGTLGTLVNHMQIAKEVCKESETRE